MENFKPLTQKRLWSLTRGGCFIRDTSTVVIGKILCFGWEVAVAYGRWSLKGYGCSWKFDCT